MSKISFTQNDRDWLSVYHPDLRFVIKEGRRFLIGTLFFDMVYYSEDHSHVIKPEKKHLTHGERIEDSYEIEIFLENDPRSNLPIVKELGGRISLSGKRHGRPLMGMHLYDNQCCCLALDQEESRLLPQGFNMPNFFCDVLIPYFYAQSYFEKHGYWKWGERTHLFPAYFEWYAEQLSTDKNAALETVSRLRSRNYTGSVKNLLELDDIEFGRQKCFCENPTGKMIKNCHPNIIRGFLRFKADTKKYEIAL